MGDQEEGVDVFVDSGERTLVSVGRKIRGKKKIRRGRQTINDFVGLTQHLRRRS